MQVGAHRNNTDVLLLTIDERDWRLLARLDKLGTFMMYGTSKYFGQGARESRP
jgi:hypothetical protein